MRTFTFSVVGLLSLLSGAAALCGEPCLNNTNGTFLTCDMAVDAFNFTCEELESWHCCDCSGCCVPEETPEHICDVPCLGSYSARDLTTMLNNDTILCTEALDNAIAPDCPLESCGCQSSNCHEVDDACGFSCETLTDAGFSCDAILDIGCDCSDCNCVTDPPPPPVEKYAHRAMIYFHPFRTDTETLQSVVG